jgi:hypothetical protein
MLTEKMSIRPVLERSLLVSSRKEVRTDLALKYAKQELAGESTLPPVAAVKRPEQSVSGTLLEEILALQAKGFVPIIIVPSASSSKSRLTTLNAQRFLKDGVFEEPNSRTMTRPDTLIEVEHVVAGQKLRFKIVDDTTRFRKDDWKCVVAVFTEGKMWQFSGWPFRAETDMFSSLLMFNLRYAEDSVDPIVTSGRIKSLLVKRSARHQDSAVMVEFWKAVEAFLREVRVRKFSNSHKLP